MTEKERMHFNKLQIGVLARRRSRRSNPWLETFELPRAERPRKDKEDA